jgi:hypothetical protein
LPKDFHKSQESITSTLSPPVARLALICTILALAASEDLETGQIDIKSTYLNGELAPNEIVFMKQPPGYAEGKLVCRLKRPLYRLKQSGRHWYQMMKLSFSRSDVDQAIFYHQDAGAKKLIVILVHVNYCSIVATSIFLIGNFKTKIKEHINITDMGELHWILGIEVKCIRKEHKILLSQTSYINSIIRHYNLEDTRPISAPMDPNICLTSAQLPSSTEDITTMRTIPYHEAIGSLMYASLGTCPDITFAVQTISRFTTNPGLPHWEAIKQIFRYLKATRHLWLCYGGKNKLEGYADADRNMAEDQRAISGYTFIINGGAVSWSAKRQETVTLSTTKSEYIAITYAAKEALWIHSLISQIFDIPALSIPLFSDNQSAIALTNVTDFISFIPIFSHRPPRPPALVYIYLDLDTSFLSRVLDYY